MRGKRGKSPNPSTYPLTIYVTEAQYEEISQRAEAAKARSISRYAKRLLEIGAEVEKSGGISALAKSA